MSLEISPTAPCLGHGQGPQVAHDKNVGSIIIGHSSHGRLHELVRGSIVQKSS